MRLFTFVVLPFLALSGVATAQQVPLVLNPGEVLLQVEAEGEFKARPDVMAINAGVTTNGKTAAEALAANNAKADRMIRAIRDAGVAPTDVRTNELSVKPVMSGNENSDRVKQPPVILGYIARNSVELRLRDLRRAPEIIDALFNAGANSVEGPDFSLSNPKPAQRQARFNAVAAAREQAETYAEAFGMRIARVIRSSERGEFRYDGGQDIIITGSRMAPTPLEPGELTTSIRLWVDYALVPK